MSRSFFNLSWPPYGHSRDSHCVVPEEENGVLCLTRDIYIHSSDGRS
jgi:hypothetical protein